MPIPQPKSKQALIDDFEMMKSAEESARDLYRRICEDSRVQQPKLKEIFAAIADDEQRHVLLVQKIIIRGDSIPDIFQRDDCVVDSNEHAVGPLRLGAHRS